MARRHVIVTCCDARCGDFLVAHWLVSLQTNVDLTGVDVVVLDYGLTEAQRGALAARGVRCFPCTKDGFVCNLRYRDMCRLFDDTDYDQVLSVDAGDVIFQADIRAVFDQFPGQFRAAPEELQIPFHELLIDRSDVRPEICREIMHFLDDKPMVNAGVVWGPARSFRQFWDVYQRACTSFRCFGVDQLILNYVLHRDGYVPLDRRYNYVLISNATPYTIRDGVFRDVRGEVIPVVHNAGNRDATRAISNFGFGPTCNQRKWLLPLGVRLLTSSFAVWKRLSRAIGGRSSGSGDWGRVRTSPERRGNEGS